MGTGLYTINSLSCLILIKSLRVPYCVFFFPLCRGGNRYGGIKFLSRVTCRVKCGGVGIQTWSSESWKPFLLISTLFCILVYLNQVFFFLFPVGLYARLKSTRRSLIAFCPPFGNCCFKLSFTTLSRTAPKWYSVALSSCQNSEPCHWGNPHWIFLDK